MPTSQQDYALAMIQQLRMLDPVISAEVGTPERKIIDTVAQVEFDSQIDLDALSQALDVDAKTGASLDRFLGLFRFERQKASYASGFVIFSRPTPANADIRIPGSSQLRAPASNDPVTGAPIPDIPFYTLYDVILPAGQTSVTSAIRASIPGVQGNVAENKITEIIGTIIPGITAVTNPIATTGGSDSETDDALKIRFKNTVFRNISGTVDQYLALAIATQFSTTANVVGSVSRYREYVQVPPVDDASSYDIDNNGLVESGFGNAGVYTTAISTIPYAKALWTANPVFISNGQTGVGAIFYRQETDFKLNTGATSKNCGDARRLFSVYGSPAQPDPTNTPNQPNISFFNVYTGLNPDVQAVRPGDVLLAEFSYMSDASRNDMTKNITNAVDVYVDGGNDIPADMVISIPSLGYFIDNINSKYHYENYRRIGQATKRPQLGNLLTPMFWQPATDVPEEIVVANNTYTRDVHYWAVEDVSSLAGTIRARSGIEWSYAQPGKLAADPDGGPYTGLYISQHTGDAVIEVKGYAYDRNIADLQAALDASKQTTSDILAHKAKIRYFKFDITVMYSQGASVTDTNIAIQVAVTNFLSGLYFGSTIQLSDILQVVHNVPGVDNVRWTADTPNAPAIAKVYETDLFGRPLLGVTADYNHIGGTAGQTIQMIYLVGQPTGGTFNLTWNSKTSSALQYNATAAQIQSALTATPVSMTGITVTEDTRSTTSVQFPIRSFRVTWSANGPQLPIDAISNLKGGPFVFTTDFFLRDQELAALPHGAFSPISGIADTIAGFIIRPRAQNTWTRTV